MLWIQPLHPLYNLGLTALAAIVPIAFIFWALIVKKMKGYKACLWATLIIFLDGIIVFEMPVQLALLSAANGMFYGLFPICWIVVTVVFLFNITVESGQFEVIKHSMASITPDRRIQALLIAFSFSSFLEGTAGFGAPVAISAAMLVGLGFNPFSAAAVCLIGNTIPSIFAAIGIPVTVLSQVSGLPMMDISKEVGGMLPLLTLLVPFFIVHFLTGFKKMIEIWPAILISGGSYTILQWISTQFIGPALPAIVSGLGSVVVLTVFLKFWEPRKIWRFKSEQKGKEVNVPHSFKETLTAWSPFLLLTFMIIIWGLEPFKAFLQSHGDVQFPFPGLNQRILTPNGTAIIHIFKFNYLSGAGTAILLSALITMGITKMNWKKGVRVFGRTIKQLQYPIILIASILGFAHIANDSGIILAIASALAGTGFLYPIFAPILGWLGVFISGSNTTSSALFGKLQATTAQRVGVDSVTMVAANAVGGTAGKIISPQSIAIGTAAVGMAGKEARLFRHLLKYSMIMLAIACLFSFGLAYGYHYFNPSSNKSSEITTEKNPCLILKPIHL